MNIKRESTGDLTAVLKVDILENDYAPAWNKALQEQQRTASLPGFRPGKVPMSIVRKRVGPSLLVREVEKLIGEGLQQHIESNKLRVLGQPIPKNDDQKNDWDKPKDFHFEYEVGMAPPLDVDFKKRKLKVNYSTIKVTDELIDKEIKDLQRRYGILSDAEVAQAKDMVLGDMIELDESGSIKEGGIMHRATISLEYLKDAAAATSFVGKKKGDEMRVDPHKVSNGHDDLARMLDIDHAQVHELKSDFLFRVEEVKRMAPKELGQELYDRIFGKDEVTDEKAFRAKVSEGLDTTFRRDADRLYRREVMKKLMELNDVKLPDDFLKRWIEKTSEEPITPEEVEKGYSDYAKGLRHQLLEDHIVEKFGLGAKEEELVAMAKQQVSQQFAAYGIPLDEGDQLNSMVDRMLRDREEFNKLRSNIVGRKLTAHFKAMLEPKEKQISFDDFVNLAQNP